MERSAGVLRPWHAGRETLKNLGAPKGSWTHDGTQDGIQLYGHTRGNPDTERCWNRTGETAYVTGRWRSTGNGNAHRIRLGSRIEHSTRRWGKPTTWGRTRRKHVARKGNSSRTCRTGIYEPTSLRALAHRGCLETDTSCTDASATEEPDAGKLHVRVCTGDVG